MVTLAPNHTVVFSALDQTYGLIDGTSRWPECLDTLIDLAEIKGCSLFLYDCGRSHSQLLESRGDSRQASGSGNSIALDDFLWRSTPGTIWSPPINTKTDHAANADRMAIPSGEHHAGAYAVIDRDHTHILYLAFSGHRPDRQLDQNARALLESLLPHLHRACRLQRSAQGQTLLQLAHPDHLAAIGSAGLPIELRLRRRFRLSKAEARVAKLLAEGLAPRTIADRLHVSIHTVRSQLQSIFQKTDTCRQAELTSLLLRETEIPAALCRTQPMSLENQGRPSCL